MNPDPPPPDAANSNSITMERGDGPLPGILLVLTFLTGLVDAISYLKLGHVFVANMTGNVAFLGFAIGGSDYFSISASVAAIAAFLCGAVVGGRLGKDTDLHRGRLIAIAMWRNVALVGSALVVAAVAGDVDAAPSRYALIVLLGLAMGLQNATARRLGIPDIATNVLTSTLTGLAADSALASGKRRQPDRRLCAVLLMLAGAAVGASLVLNVGICAALGVALSLLVANAIAASRAAKSTAAWTLGT